MASIYDLKPAFQRILRPLTRTLASAGITANQVTLAACLMSLATASLIAWENGSRRVLLLLPAVFFVRMALNAIDGMLAREHGMKSRLGGILNELTDVISDSAICLSFATIDGARADAVVAVTLLSVISEMAGVVAVTIGASRRYDGPMGKSDRAFAFGLLALLLGVGVPAGAWVNVYFAVLWLLLCATIWNRSRRALQEGN